MAMGRSGLAVASIVSVLAFVPAAYADAPGDVPPAARTVRQEALRAPRGDPEGRPLPLLAHWHRMTTPPAWQVEMIRRGHPFLPWVAYSREMAPERIEQQDGEAIGVLRKWNLPVVLLTGGQWEADFYSRDEYKNAPADQTGVTVGPNGEKLNSVSPFSPVEPWRKLGVKWTDNPACRKLQELYPDPPLVFFLTNNEAHDLRWSDAERDKRYLEKYGAGRSDEFKRKVVGDGWIERYRALIDGMRSGLASETWRANCRVMAYNGFGPDHLGRSPGWAQWSLATADRVSISWHMWQGAVPEAYDNAWEGEKMAFHVYSSQVEMMNLVFMKDLAWETDAGFWLEVIFWDGDAAKAAQYEEAGIAYTPELYGGWVQYVLWTLTPRVAREWRGSSYRRDAGWWPYFAAIIRAVDLVHADEVLKRFWRKGELVPNRSAPHPFSHDVPERYAAADRWFHLPTDCDPPRPWTLTTRIPVFTLARVLGTKPRREWLLYAHAPMGAREGVQVTIPDYGPVKVDVPVGGCFHLIREADGSITAVGDPRQVVLPSNVAPTARDDEYALAAGQALETSVFRFRGMRDVLRNDTDDDGDPMTAELVAGPKHGELELRADGTFVYKPAAGFRGADSFTYRARDLARASEPAAVTIRVVDGPVRVIDDGDAGFEDASQWLTTDGGGGFGGDIAYYQAGPGGGSTATWTFTDLPAGEYDVYATWPLFSYQRPTKVPVEILDGRTSRAQVAVNQDALPQGEEADGVAWQALARAKVDSGTLKVVLSNAARGRWVVADAVRIVPAGGGQARTIDNGQAGYSEQPRWLAHDRGFGGDSRYVRGDKEKERAGQASWTFDGVEPGVYEVFVTWPAGANRTAVLYTVFDGERQKASVRLDQTTQPSDLLALGATWASLGEFAAGGGSIRVVLSSHGAKNDVLADAVALSARRPREKEEAPRK